MTEEASEDEEARSRFFSSRFKETALSVPRPFRNGDDTPRLVSEVLGGVFKLNVIDETKSLIAKELDAISDVCTCLYFFKVARDDASKRFKI